MLYSSRDKYDGVNHSSGDGEKPVLADPGCELHLAREKDKFIVQTTY